MNEDLPLQAVVVENPCQSCEFPYTIHVTVSKHGGQSAKRICANCGFPFVVNSQRMMLEIGVEGHLFNKHKWTSQCGQCGCVPFDERVHVAGTHGTYQVNSAMEDWINV